MLSLDNLLEQFKAGDRLAFKRIYMEYVPKVYRFAQRYMKDDNDVEDIVQEVFIRLWTVRTSVNPTLSFDNYLFTIARNLIFNHHRARINEVYLQDTVLASLEKESYMPEDEIIAQDLSQYIDKIVEQLPAKQQEVFKLSRHQMLTYREIAEQLGISEKTVESHIYQALKFIRKEIKREENLKNFTFN